MDSLQAFLLQWSYFGLFALLVLGIVGLPIPDETLLVLSGYLIGEGKLNLAVTFAAAIFGAACGISGSYWLGRTLGQAAVLRFGRYLHLTPERLESVHCWFQRFGNWLLTVGYFIPGVRHLTALVAGMSGIEFRTFALFAYPGAAIWVSTFLLLGRTVGQHWQQALSTLHHSIVLASVVLVVLGSLIAAIWWSRQHRRQH